MTDQNPTTAYDPISWPIRPLPPWPQVCDVCRERGAMEASFQPTVMGLWYCVECYPDKRQEHNYTTD